MMWPYFWTETNEDFLTGKIILLDWDIFSSSQMDFMHFSCSSSCNINKSTSQSYPMPCDVHKCALFGQLWLLKAVLWPQTDLSAAVVGIGVFPNGTIRQQRWQNVMPDWGTLAGAAGVETLIKSKNTVVTIRSLSSFCSEFEKAQRT